MGINGLWEQVTEVTQGEVVDLACLSADCMQRTGRPLRVAVDASVLIFKYKNATERAASAGGRNHPTRNIFYNIMHLNLAGVQPIYVFDGDQRPEIKRGYCVGHSTAPSHAHPIISPPVRSREDVDREYSFPQIIALCRNMLKLMGVPFHQAPGEAEAECVALERAGIVDAILTSDGDALAFGGIHVLKPLNKSTKNGRTVSSAHAFNAESFSTGQKLLTKEHLVLLALMAGGDYNHGIPGCGPKKAMELARAGEADALFKIHNSGAFVTHKLKCWRNRIATELRKTSLTVARNIPDQFPDPEILDLYIRPAVSSEEKLQYLKDSSYWNRPVDVPGLQAYMKEHFNWLGQDYARKFVKLTAPFILANRFLLRSQQEGENASLFEAIRPTTTRNAVTGESPDEIRLEYVPQDVVGIDWEAEPIMPHHSYDASHTFKPGQAVREWFPAFFVERRAPTFWMEFAAATTSKSKKRKGDADSAVAPSAQAELLVTKRRPGRPRKNPEPPAATGEQVQSEPEKKRGRPRKDAALPASSGAGSTPKASKPSLQVLHKPHPSPTGSTEHWSPGLAARAGRLSGLPPSSTGMLKSLPPIDDDTAVDVPQSDTNAATNNMEPRPISYPMVGHPKDVTKAIRRSPEDIDRTKRNDGTRHPSSFTTPQRSLGSALSRKDEDNDDVMILSSRTVNKSPAFPFSVLE